MLAAKQVFTLLPTAGIISLFAELLFCYRDNYRGGKERRLMVLAEISVSAKRGTAQLCTPSQRSAAGVLIICIFWLRELEATRLGTTQSVFHTHLDFLVSNKTASQGRAELQISFWVSSQSTTTTRTEKSVDLRSLFLSSVQTNWSLRVTGQTLSDDLLLLGVAAT